ncbi:MAG: hypothetical protein IPO97_10005 [Sphingomonadales bacterium]|nr:hypothetical protein [Sphingomonadales bacterium]
MWSTRRSRRRFNRQEVCNLFGNPYTTTRPAITFGKRQQYLLLREQFKDETFLADATIKLGLGGVDLTSVTSYIKRDILVSRDASALTGSVSVDLGYPAAGVLLPSNLRDTTDPRHLRRNCGLSSNGDGPFQGVRCLYSKIDRTSAQRPPSKTAGSL